jgi:DNA polymerase-3 subunit alpha
MSAGFVHLRVHTEYSIVDSIVRVHPLMKAVSELGMDAVGISDHCNFFAAVKVYQAAVSQGIKPLLGVDLPCCYQDTPNEVSLLSILCQNLTGYKHATQLVSKAYQEGQVRGSPRVAYDWLAMHTEGLLALSGGSQGVVDQCLAKGDLDGARRAAKTFADLFPGRFYLEIQRTGRANETELNMALVALADELHLPLVATNEVRFLKSNEYEAHEARVCIHDGCTIAESQSAQRYSAQQYLKSAEEMAVLFADLPQALENTVEISKRCTVQMQLGKAYLPKFPAPKDMTEGDYLVKLAKQELEVRLQHLFGAQVESHRAQYAARLDLELEVIQSMGFPGYFLIVADFIGWAKANGIPVGPGRGSGAGSLVAYVLKITDLDPLAYDLLFERFLNPERVSMPDFDVDFCMEGRDRVIDYVAQKYGRHSVSQIITFGTMAAKAVVRDVGRVLGHPYGFVDKLAKLIPFELGITLEKALKDNPELKQRYDDEEEVKELFTLALHLEGLTKNPGKHAGGVVIAPAALTDFTAVYCEAGSNQQVSQFDKDDVEAAGLVKFDFLGLRTLTIIDWALKSINHLRAKTQLEPIQIEHIPLDCPKTFALLKACKTTAVFQLESRGMKELIHRLEPDSFEEIIALVALFRPGPLQSGMVDDFINRKHGRAKVSYPHRDLEPILKATYGVILYQEQVMQIAQVLANYTLGAADLLRRAMGKKKPEEMAQQRVIFVEGASSRGISDDVSGHIFDLMEKFAGYGFNKSHSAAYALISYQTAWLKAHYPAAFMAAVLSSDMDNTEKVVGMIEDCRQLKLTLLPPSVETSDHHFTVASDHEIRYGLGAIKGVGEAAIMLIKAARPTAGFGDLFGFCKRLDLRKVNRRVIEALIKSGAMDDWGSSRSQLMASLEEAISAAEQHHQYRSQLDLFGLLDESHVKPQPSSAQEWTLKACLKFEKETLGLYLSGHPASTYHDEFGGRFTLIAELNPTRNKKASICALVTAIRTVVTKRGKTLMIVGLEDKSAKFEALFLADTYQRVKPVLLVGEVLVIEGEISLDEYTGKAKMVAAQCYSIEQARSLFAKCLLLKLTSASKPSLTTLQAVLKSAPGHSAVELCYQNDQAGARLSLGKNWKVTVTDELMSNLKMVLGETNVEMCYD